MSQTPPVLEAQVDATAERVEVQVTDRSTEATEAFADLTPGQQRAFAGELWSLGLRATRSAQRQAEESRLKDIGQTLQLDLTSALQTVLQRQHEQVGTELRRYFDPESGALNQRLRGFLADDGELARTMSGFLAPERSVLAETLAAQVGQSSPLLKKLSATDAEGVVQTLKAQLSLVLEHSQAALRLAMDPLNPDGPIARFLTTLQAGLKAQEGSLAKQMEVACRALDANDPTSPLSNLVRRSDEASAQLAKAMNVADADSPLAQLKHGLTELLQANHLQAGELLRLEAERRDHFEKQVLATVTRLETQRAVNRNAPQGGRDFEAAAAAAVREFLSHGPYLFNQTGTVVGLRPNCKVGDFVVRFGDESKWEGTRVVFECKHQQSVRLDEALRELEIARANRECQAGVYVMASSLAHADFPAFARYGNSILVTWDPDDESSSSRLNAAVMVALALATRKPQIQDDASVDGLKEIEVALAVELERVGKLRKASDGIRKHNEDIKKELDKAQDQLTALVDTARETLRALDAVVDDEGEDRAEPIRFGKRRDSTAA